MTEELRAAGHCPRCRRPVPGGELTAFGMCLVCHKREIAFVRLENNQCFKCGKQMDEGNDGLFCCECTERRQ